MLQMIALFPSLPTVQFLIVCSMQKQKGGRRGPLYYVNDISRQTERGEGSLVKRTSLRPFLVVSVPNTSFERLLSKKRTTPCSKRRTHVRNTIGDPSPLLSTQVDTDVIHIPSILTYWKNWMVGRPGDKASKCVLILYNRLYMWY